MDQRTRKLMTMHKALCKALCMVISFLVLFSEMTLTDYMSQEEEKEDLLALKTALMHRYNDSKTT